MAMIPSVRGRRKGVVIGVGNRGTQRALLGASYDAQQFGLMLARHGYAVQALIEKEGSTLMPVRDNVRQALQWLVKDAQAGDSLVLYFSGHGERVPCSACDGEDTAIVCTGEDHICSSELAVLCASLPCRLLAVWDCCHGDAMLRLPHVLSEHKTPKHKHKHNCPLLTQIVSHAIPLHLQSAMAEIGAAGSDVQHAMQKSDLEMNLKTESPSSPTSPQLMFNTPTYTRCVLSLAACFGSRARECANVKGIECQSELIQAWSSLPGDGFGESLEGLISVLNKTMGKYGWRKYRPRVHKRGPVLLGSSPYALRQQLGL